VSGLRLRWSTAFAADDSSAFGRWRAGWRLFARNRLAVAGAALLCIEIVLAFVGPAVAPYDPSEQAFRPLQGPSLQNLMGTDDIGRDVFSRLLHGTPISLLEGLGVLAIASLAGIPLGLVAAYFRRADAVIMRASEIMLAFPSMFLAIGLVAVIGTNLFGVILAVGISGMWPTAVLTRSVALDVLHEDYVLAARAVGCRDSRIIFSHIVPNAAGPLLVAASFRVADGILTVAAISFIGLGAQPPTPEWGAMLSNGREYLFSAVHVSAFPGLALAVTVLAFNLLGDGLRDVFDPRYNR
jgi:ABC-type dipeptide/oligopeptide/nickel transport system permease subunit